MRVPAQSAAPVPQPFVVPDSIYSDTRAYCGRLADDSPKDTLARLKDASEALDAAQKASKTTVREVARAKRVVAKIKKASKVLPAPHKLKRKSARKR